MYGSYANAELDDDGLIQVADALHCHIGGALVALLGVISEVERREAWRDSGPATSRTGSRSDTASRGGRPIDGSRPPAPSTSSRA
jgi:hypothetical protein